MESLESLLDNQDSDPLQAEYWHRGEENPSIIAVDVVLRLETEVEDEGWGQNKQEVGI